MRRYTVQFDDGDLGENIGDADVFSQKDYLFQIPEEDWKGIKSVKGNKRDFWAATVGWYEVSFGKIFFLYIL